MGSFYTNYTLRGPTPEAVAGVLAGREAFVTPISDGCVVVFDKESDEQNEDVIAEVACALSGELRCPVLAVLNHDDSVLWYQLYLNGELADHYDSCPGYFEEDPDESDGMPEGGDSEKLCQAFGSNAVAEVEKILRKSSFGRGGYTFAIERHADLVAALGIPGFSVGAGFELISNGELPDELNADNLIDTTDFVTAQSSRSTADGGKPLPGYYQVKAGAVPNLKNPVPVGWMPNLWNDMQCKETDFSQRFLLATAAHRAQFAGLGFAEQVFNRNDKALVVSLQESSGIKYLDQSRSYLGQLIYSRVCKPSSNVETEQIVIAFTAVFPNGIFSCTNKMNPFPPTLPNHKVLRIESNDVAFIYHRFCEGLKERTETPRTFADVQALEKWFDSNALELFEHWMRQGLFERMTPFEVARTRLKAAAIRS